MIEPTEQVISEKPFVVRRRVRWSECDPAGVVYTGNFTDYLISAVGLFHEHLFGGQPSAFRQEQRIQTPCKAMSLVFKRALWPGELFDMQVSVADIRSSTYDIAVSAFLPDGTPVFSGQFTPVCIPTNERKAIAIPEVMRQRLAAASLPETTQ